MAPLLNNDYCFYKMSNLLNTLSITVTLQIFREQISFINDKPSLLNHSTYLTQH